MEIQVSKEVTRAVLVYGIQSYKYELAKKVAQAFGPNVLIVGLSNGRTIKDVQPDTSAVVIVSSLINDFDYEEYFNYITKGIALHDVVPLTYVHPKLVFLASTFPKEVGASFHDRFEIIRRDEINVDIEDVTIKLV